MIIRNQMQLFSLTLTSSFEAENEWTFVNCWNRFMTTKTNMCLTPMAANSKEKFG